MQHPHPDQHYGCFTYSQHGEDIVFLNIFKLLGIEKGTYLDIGAHHPTNISNTKLLYDKGWRGVNVDANPNVMEDFYRERPRDVNVHSAVDIIKGQVELYLYSKRSGRNTIDAREVEELKGWALPRETVKVDAVTINEIVGRFCPDRRFPDLLSLDIEGMDYAVLATADFETYGSPKVICVETRLKHTRRMHSLMLSRDFTLYVRMGENLIFVKNELLAQVFGVQVEDEIS